MKGILQIIVFCACLNANAFGQDDIQGYWLVCDSTNLCENESLQLYMLINESTISYVFPLSAGLDPELTRPSYYTLEDNILHITDTSSTAEVFKHQYRMIWNGPDQLVLKEIGDDFQIYLYRKED